MSPLHHQALFNTARKVVSSTKQILGDDARHSRMVLVGGLAVMRLTDNYRMTTDIDFFVGGNLKPSVLKKELPRVCRDFTTNMEAMNGITFRCPVTKTIVPVDLIDKSVTGFEPKSEALQSFEAGKLPWASRDDLITMKAYGASKRDDELKLVRDVTDIVRILSMHPGPLVFERSSLAREKRDFVRNFLPLLVEHSDWSEKEWLERLGL